MAAAVLASSCANAPDVQQHVTASARVWVTGGDRVLYRVDLLLDAVDGASTDAASYLSVDVATCGKTCGTPLQFVATLGSANVDVTDLKNIAVKYTAFGKPVLVKFTGPGPSQTNQSPAVAGSQVSVASPWPVVAKVTMFGVTCEDKAGQAARAISVYAAGYTRPANRKDAPVRAVAGAPSGASRCSAAR